MPATNFAHSLVLEFALPVLLWAVVCFSRYVAVRPRAFTEGTGDDGSGFAQLRAVEKRDGARDRERMRRDLVTAGTLIGDTTRRGHRVKRSTTR